MHLHGLKHTKFFAALLTAFDGQAMAPRPRFMWTMVERNPLGSELVIIVRLAVGAIISRT
jgi:hypothetical protein